MYEFDIINQHGAELKAVIYRMFRYSYGLPIVGPDPVANGEAIFEQETTCEGIIAYTYIDARWTCMLIIVGSNPRSEFLMVQHEADMCFTMGVDARVINLRQNGELVESLLKNALATADASMAWHRTHKFYTNDYREGGYYVNHWQGDISSFRGAEKIVLPTKELGGKPEIIYTATYHGQVVGQEAMCYNEFMTKVTLRKLSREDGAEERKFLLQFPLEENGFERPGRKYSLESPEGFAEFVEAGLKHEQGEGLPEGYVPDTLFWILSDGKLAGVAKVRHCLTAALREHGGHIGLGIADEYRGQGVGTEALIQLVNFTKGLGEEKVLVTIQENNTASRMMTEHAGGKLEKVVNGRAYYWL